MNITVKDRQSLADVALMACGSVEGMLALALRNGVSMSAELEECMVLDYEASDVVAADVVARYAMEGVAPATGISERECRELCCCGIGVDAIEYDFTVR